MNKEKQRIAIAEACGMIGPFDDRWIKEYEKEGGDAYGFTGFENGELVFVRDYLNDLNAMHQAEKALTDEQFFSYGEHLDKITLPEDKMQMCYVACPEVGMYRELICATAAQRAEAFLKTLNLWEDE